MNFNRVFPPQVVCFLSSIKFLKDFVDPVSVVVDFFFICFCFCVVCKYLILQVPFLQLFDSELHSNACFSYGLSRYLCREEGDLSIFGVNLQFTTLLIGFLWLPLSMSLVVFCYGYLLLFDLL